MESGYPVPGVSIHGSDHCFDILQRSAGIDAPDKAQATPARSQPLHAVQDVGVRLFGPAENRDILTVDVQVEENLAPGQAANIVQPVDQILGIEDRDAALDEIGDNLQDVAIRVQRDMDSVGTAVREEALRRRK